MKTFCIAIIVVFSIFNFISKSEAEPKSAADLAQELMKQPMPLNLKSTLEELVNINSGTNNLYMPRRYRHMLRITFLIG